MERENIYIKMCCFVFARALDDDGGEMTFQRKKNNFSILQPAATRSPSPTLCVIHNILSPPRLIARLTHLALQYTQSTCQGQVTSANDRVCC